MRWYRLSEQERAAIRNPAAWLTRVASRVALDELASARARRERYIGQWLPEPVPSDLFAGTAPARGIGRHRRSSGSGDDRRAVSTALLTVLGR